MNKFFFSVLASLAFVLSGCVENTGAVSALSGGVSKGKTSAEISLEKEARSLSQISRNIVTKHTLQGAAAGAAAGCLAAALMGKDCVKGAVVGGIAGGVGGHAYGKKGAKANVTRVNQRELITKLSGVNKKLNSIEIGLRRVVASQNSEVASLRRRLASNQVSQSQYSSRIRAINSNRSAVRSGLLRAENNVAKSHKSLISLAKQDKQTYSTGKRAFSSTQNRFARTRKSISLVAVK